MSTLIQEPELATGTSPIVIHMQPVLNLSEDEFFHFCQINRELRIERNAQGELIIMSPTGGESGDQDSEINMQLRNWSKRNGTGTTFSSSTGFRLPNGSVRSPDASWISYARLNTLSKEQRRKFIPLCPEFVIELRSPSDLLSDLRAKMQEYLENGVQLGLLIVPEQKRVYIYQPNQPVQELEGCDTVSCDSVLPGFELVVKEIW